MEPTTELVSVGDEVKVIADSLPAPYGHRCFDVATNTTYFGRTLALGDNMLGHHFFYCSAFNTISGVTNRGNASFPYTVQRGKL